MAGFEGGALNRKAESADSLIGRTTELINTWNNAAPSTRERRDAGRALIDLIPQLVSGDEVESLATILRESSSTMNSGVRSEAAEALMAMIKTGNISNEELISIGLDKSIKSVEVREAARDVVIQHLNQGLISDQNTLEQLAACDSLELRDAAKEMLRK